MQDRAFKSGLCRNRRVRMQRIVIPAEAINQRRSGLGFVIKHNIRRPFGNGMDRFDRPVRPAKTTVPARKAGPLDRGDQGACRLIRHAAFRIEQRALVRALVDDPGDLGFTNQRTTGGKRGMQAKALFAMQDFLPCQAGVRFHRPKTRPRQHIDDRGQRAKTRVAFIGGAQVRRVQRIRPQPQTKRI